MTQQPTTKTIAAIIRKHHQTWGSAPSQAKRSVPHAYHKGDDEAAEEILALFNPYPKNRHVMTVTAEEDDYYINVYVDVDGHHLYGWEIATHGVIIARSQEAMFDFPRDAHAAALAWAYHHKQLGYDFRPNWWEPKP